jgi:hypothetical protein
MMRPTRYVVLERLSTNRLNRAKLKEKLSEIAAIAARNQKFGFAATIGPLREPELTMDPMTASECWRYVAKIRIEKEKPASDPQVLDRQFDQVLSLVTRTAESRRWKVVEANGGAAAPDKQESPLGLMPRGERREFVLPELTDVVFATYFRDVYEREDQIAKVHAAVRMSVVTMGEILPHVLLYGRPGACKTKMMERFKDWYEADDPGVTRVEFVDGTSMTKAGLERYLLDLAEADALPEILVVDEIEKQEKDNLLSLLSVMGSGVIARLNARIGNTRRRARFVLVGICNDEKSLQAFRDGALWSRFGGNKLFCPRPSRDLCLKILYAMVSTIPGGNPRWAEEALQFAWDELGCRDIREIKDHLCGMDQLLTGEWQQSHRRMIYCRLMEEQELALEREVMR